MDNLLTQDDLDAVRSLRRALHRTPELSGQERETADRIRAELAALGADTIETGIGGHGLLATFAGARDGPLVVLRAELDGLPIPESSGVEHASERDGRGHLCGHDGHMATLVCVARALSRSRPARGRVALLFQPAEETGQGARAMLDDPRIAGLAPAAIFAQHNLPGLPLGRVALRDGPVACASCGMRIALTGRTAHASQPETGLSPRAALAELLVAMDALNAGLPLEDPGFAMATVTHCAMGERAFGIAPGVAEIWTTLRSLEDRRMAEMRATAEAAAHRIAAAHGLEIDIRYDDVFDSTVNDPGAVATLSAALDACGVSHSQRGQPWRPSEDFGQFARIGPAAMFYLGAGESHPALHDQRYDFPDDNLETGARIFLGAIDRICGDATG